MIPKLPKFLNSIRHNAHPENNPHRKNEVTGKRYREPVCLKQNILICLQIEKVLYKKVCTNRRFERTGTGTGKQILL